MAKIVLLGQGANCVNEMARHARRSEHWGYRATISEFLAADQELILGHLAQHTPEVTDLDRFSWLGEIDYLRRELAGQTSGYIYFEFTIPRLGKRIDVVLVIDQAVFLLEFKVGESKHKRDTDNQVWDYALDLKYFHSTSTNANIFPIAISTKACASKIQFVGSADGVFEPIRCGSDQLSEILRLALQLTTGGSRIEVLSWERGVYHPTPTIIEAARALYQSKNVEDITRHSAGAMNLAVTSKRVYEIVERCRRDQKKAICFVTGVPGAGKTLVGLDLATKQHDPEDKTHSVFLSGNGPLVSVLQSALANDEVTRSKLSGRPKTKKDASRLVASFVQNVHHFRDACLVDATSPPVNHVVVFDEAQRAWNLRKTSDFMHKKKNIPGFGESEPEFLISCFDRHQDWAVIVCLVGNGQEINQGEAGISEWLSAIDQRFPDWLVHISPRLISLETVSSDVIASLKSKGTIIEDRSLHLATSVRSFRSERVSDFVNDVLGERFKEASDTLREVLSTYPILVTRELEHAKAWLRKKTRGNERCGVLASSGAGRLRPIGIDVRVKTDPTHFFLSGDDDVRSSNYLEDVGTEFQVQGLELDWTAVVWDANLRLDSGSWSFHTFSGTKWQTIRDSDRRAFLLNAYRVLLTRARQGMVIVVPTGSESDPTRPRGFYDGTYLGLVGLGIPVLDSSCPTNSNG